MVWAAINQSSRSLSVYSVVKAVLDVADGLKLKFCHTGRRSEVGVKVADHLSKGELVELKGEKKREVSKQIGYFMNNMKA